LPDGFQSLPRNLLMCAQDKSITNMGKWSWYTQKTRLKWRIVNKSVEAKHFQKQLGTRLLASFPPVCPSVLSPVLSIGTFRSPLAVLCQGNVLCIRGYNSRFPSFYCYKEHISIFSFSTMFVNVYWLLWLGKISTKSPYLVLIQAETDVVKTSCINLSSVLYVSLLLA
jgi:hypothetical protein